MPKCTRVYTADIYDDEIDYPFMADVVLDDLKEIRRLWPKDLTRPALDKIDGIIEELKEEKAREERWAPPTIYSIQNTLVFLMSQLEEYSSQQQQETGFSMEIFNLLHPNIVKNSYDHFIRGYYREAVLNACMAVFDHIRKRTNLDLDGYDLVRKAFLEKPPLLIVSTLNTDSGKSEQTGFANLLSGAYSNFRNPIAHSGNDQMSKDVVGQILIFASYLAKRIEESITPPEDK